MQRSVIIVSSLFSLLLASSCTDHEPTATKKSSNGPPGIISITANPPQIGKSQTSMLSVLAVNIENEEIQYAWSAAQGAFLQGTNRKFAIWQAPDMLGRYECSVSISDGQETTIGKIHIDVVEVPILQVSTDALDYSYCQNEQSFTVENIGKANLIWQISPAKSWLQANPPAGQLAYGEKVAISIVVNRDHLNGGEYTGLAGIRSNGGDRDIAVYLDVPVTPVMLHIPAGEFTMGSAAGVADELPVHTVMLDEYWIDRYEVTNSQYAEFLNEIKPDIEKQRSLTIVKKDGRYLAYLYPIYRDGHNVGSPIIISDGRYTVERHEANTPVRFVTWYGALAFARFYGKRLPTEAEWEKAARGVKANVYPWGNAAPTQWYCNSDDLLGYLTRVGFYSPLGDSPFGCTDMAGSVWEWCSSLYRPYPYDKNDGRENLTEEGYRVLRGGAWDSPYMNLRSALRSYNEPLYEHPSFGFRCAK